MAQNAVGRLFRCQNSVSLRQSIGALTQRRSYTKNAVPTFPPTSSTELDQALNRIREELFIPYGITLAQRRVISRPKYSDELDREPVTVWIGENKDEPFILRPNDPQSRPTKKEIVETMTLFKTKQDWQNILPFLAGLKMSNRVLNGNRMEWLVRKAGAADALGVLLECAKRADVTGFRLNKIGVAQQYFFEIHKKAQKGKFRDEALSKCLTLARQTLLTMDAPEHQELDEKLDPKRQPCVIGVRLELEAARALNELGGLDFDGHVVNFVQKLFATWSLGNFQTPKSWTAADQLLQENTPILNGMKLAMKVRGIADNKSISGLLKSRINELSVLLNKAKDMAPMPKMQTQPSAGYLQSKFLN